MLHSPLVKDFVQKDAFLYEFWTENSGMLVEDWLDVAKLYDVIDKELKAGLKVPRWARTYLADMKRITDYAFTWIYNTATSLQLKV
ncbi:lysosomal acid phosphatase, partial [Caerostris extrusa]